MSRDESPDKDAERGGLAFLEELESKHNQVLAELEQLNARIEGVLDEYLKSRHARLGNGESRHERDVA
jgi:hypothetical protein